MDNWKYNIIVDPIHPIEVRTKEITDHLMSDLESFKYQRFSLMLKQRVDQIVGRHAESFKQWDWTSALFPMRSSWEFAGQTEIKNHLIITFTPVAYVRGIRTLGDVMRLGVTFVI